MEVVVVAQKYFKGPTNQPLDVSNNFSSCRLSCGQLLNPSSHPLRLLKNAIPPCLVDSRNVQLPSTSRILSLCTHFVRDFQTMSSLRLSAARTSQFLQNSRNSAARISLQSQSILRSRLIQSNVSSLAYVSRHSFHHARRLAVDDKKQAKEEHSPKFTSEDPQESAESREKEKTSSSEGDTKEEKTQGEQDAKDGDKKKKTAPPPPPPHGDKSPWQVFTETLKTEFAQSKEWNESTKQLAEGTNSFIESESVRKAREAYSKTSGAVSSTTGRVLKTTAGAVGKGAAYAWETPVVKGVRVGVTATADVLDAATKPIRETEAYKNVKNVIDDGSSSKYGGWTEKEERRARREARLLRESGGAPGKKYEVPVEDPE